LEWRLSEPKERILSIQKERLSQPEGREEGELEVNKEWMDEKT
jgi:hypothetical protein